MLHVDIIYLACRGHKYATIHLKHCMHLNVKSIFYMTIDGYKSCRKLRKQVFNTELNICYKNTKYSSMILMVAVAKWLADFPLDSYIPGSSSAKRNFIFQKISWLKGHWNVPAIQSTEWWLKSDWNPPFPS